jgi:hypothetical protein
VAFGSAELGPTCTTADGPAPAGAPANGAVTGTAVSVPAVGISESC